MTRVMRTLILPAGAIMIGVLCRAVDGFRFHTWFFARLSPSTQPPHNRAVVSRPGPSWRAHTNHGQ